MKRLLHEILHHQVLVILIVLLLVMPTFTAHGGVGLDSSKNTCLEVGNSNSVDLRVGLYKSITLKLKKMISLVTLTKTNKEDSQSDATIEISDPTKDELKDKPSLLQKRTIKDGSQSGTKNTNKFVSLDELTPYELKIDGIKIGNTSMIIWTKDEGDTIYTKTFFNVKVVGNQDEIESLIHEFAPDVLVQFANETIVLTGNVLDEQKKIKAEKIAKSFEQKVLNYINVDNPQQVLLEVKVAQVDKTSLKKLGISFMLKGSSGEVFTNMVGAPTGASTGNTISTGVGGTTTSQGSGTGISGNIAGLGSYSPLDSIQVGASYFKGGIGTILQALVTKGHAKVLSEPNLLVKSGQEGNFLAGSRIPYSVVANVGGLAATTIVYESVGIRLKFKPEVQENGLIHLKIDPAEVSSIAGTMAVNGYPIIDTREVRTNVELKDGESLVLAGLLQEEQIKTMSKIPLLGDIPILGALFRSTQNDLKEKELVFFITPKIVKPLAKGVKQELPTDRKLTPEQERELKWMPLGE